MKKIGLDKIILGLGLIGLTVLCLSLGIYLVIHDLPIGLKVSLSLGLVLIIVYAGFNWDIIKNKLFTRQAFKSTNTGLFILIIISIIALVNYVGIRHHKRFDLTKSKKYTLSGQTIKLIHQLKEPLTIYVFYGRNNPFYPNVENLLKEYKAVSNRIQVEYIDPDVNPGRTRQFNARDGNSIMEYQDRKETITGYDERDFSAGILKILNKENKKIYFLTGHGELDIDDYNQLGYTQIKNDLERENYLVSKLNLSLQTTFPADISVLIIAGPKTELFSGEINLIRQYLDKGGKAMIMLNPPPAASLNNLLNTRGIQANENVIIDPFSTLVGGDIFSPVIGEYSYHDVTRGLPVTVFPYSRSLSVDSNLPPSLTTEKILETNRKSWAKSDLKFKSPEFDPQKDKSGPLSIGILVQSKPGLSPSSDTSFPIPETRLAIFGNANFAGNEPVKLGGNRDLFLNSINWLTGDLELLGIRAKEPDFNEITLIGSQARLVGFTSLVFIPGIIILCGFVAWLRRR